MKISDEAFAEGLQKIDGIIDEITGDVTEKKGNDFFLDITDLMIEFLSSSEKEFAKFSCEKNGSFSVF